MLTTMGVLTILFSPRLGEQLIQPLFSFTRSVSIMGSQSGEGKISKATNSDLHIYPAFFLLFGFLQLFYTTSLPPWQKRLHFW